MSNRLNDIRDQLVATFAAINGAGVYTYNLSAAGAVVVGDSAGNITPDVSLTLLQGDVSMEPGSTLSRYTFRVTWHLGALCPSLADTPGARVTAANLMLADIIYALAANRWLNNGVRNLVRDAVPTFQAGDGQTFGWPGMGAVAGEIVMEWEDQHLGGTAL